VPGPVFIHCKRGTHRTGALVAIYRIARNGWDTARALNEANERGMRPWYRGLRRQIETFDASVIQRAPATLALALSCLLTDAAFAQEPATRAEADRKRREENAAQTKPYEPNGVERAIKFAETRGIFILDREGFYPKLGSLTSRDWELVGTERWR
jgi:Tyrosine phosphatase family